MTTTRRGRRAGPWLDPLPPGEILREEVIRPPGLSINRPARDLAVAPNRIGAIVNGKRAITADAALRLATDSRVSPELWLDLPSDDDLRVLRRTAGQRIIAPVCPRAA